MPRKTQFEDPPFDGPFEGDNTTADPGPDLPVSAVGAVIRKHEARLLATAGVKSIGEGRNEIGDPAIEVGVAHAGVAVPHTLDGVPVVVRVVGEVDAQGKRRKR